MLAMNYINIYFNMLSVYSTFENNKLDYFLNVFQSKQPSRFKRDKKKKVKCNKTGINLVLKKISFT